MSHAVVRNESPIEFFRDLVEAAMQNQHVSARDATSFYVVNMLSEFVYARAVDEPLCTRLIGALQAADVARRSTLRSVGDESLFVSGFFSDSLSRSLVDIDYYVQLGERAYRALARQDDTLGDVFEELAVKFTHFVDVLNEVSERTYLSSNADVLRLYEKWLRTGSRRSGTLLASRGIVPNVSLSSRFIQ